MKCNAFISFIVLTYNEENTVIETLESIKNQVVKYENNIQLIVCDDFSTDGTFSIINSWCIQNESFFESIEVLPSDMNRGINGNFLRSLSYIKADYFKTIAGDDIWYPINTDKWSMKADICIGGFMPFSENIISNYAEDYKDHYLFFESDIKKVKKVSKYVYPFNTQSWLIKSSMLTDEVKESIRQYSFMEDRPMWYTILKSKTVESIDYYNIPFVLYRKSSSSVTNKDSKSYLLHRVDMVSFFDFQYENTNGIIPKWCIYCFKKQFMNSQRIIWKILNPMKVYIGMSRMLRRERSRKYVEDLLQNYLTLAQEHLNMISKQSKVVSEKMK